jgi:mycothiol synthase
VVDSPTELQTHQSLGHLAIAAVTDLLAAVTAYDGIAPLGEHYLHQLQLAEPTSGNHHGRTHLLAHLGDELVAYAQLDPRAAAGTAAELAVAPGFRQRGWGRRLVDHLIVTNPTSTLRIWAHGDLPGSAQLAARTGFTKSRGLHQMWVRLAGDLPAVELPAGVRLRTFLPDLDDAEWLAVNGAAFVDLPDQGDMTQTDLTERKSQKWFDPSGFLLAVDESDHILGFHWTKVHELPSAELPQSTAHEGHSHDHAKPAGHGHVGEVYVVGVDPSQQGRRLGRALTLAGLHHLQRAGLLDVMLYVDEDNTAAVRLYQALGFSTQRTDIEYRR